jgi:hypothetical protein
MKIISTLVAMILLIAVSFFLGMTWQKYSILESGTMELQSPLILQSESGLGQLPRGAILYPYSSGPSIKTFAVFINTQNLNVLEPFSFEKPFTMVPLDAYSE